MTSFNYVIARFLPDIIKNEPINLGIIVHSPKTGQAYGRFIENFRPLGARYHDVNISALKGVVETFRGEYKIESNDYLPQLTKDFRYQLIFTEPNGIISSTPQKAVEELFERYISIDIKKRDRKITMTKPRLRSLIRQNIKEIKIDKWMVNRPKLKGKISEFTWDFGFKNGKIDDLIHAITFDVKPETSLLDAKALAISVEDLHREDEDLSCIAILHPPHDDDKNFEYYEYAKGHLKDKECAIKEERQIPQLLATIQTKLSKHKQ
ncbi:MAG: DUF3037 domain-containing protein [Thaumarchaeota archaeon]|nr:DUF3037 domain-containing protein [Nitrososphaerota archaeon]